MKSLNKLLSLSVSGLFALSVALCFTSCDNFLNKDVPQMEEIDTEEEIRQIRMRGERLISMYEENDQ